MAKNKLSPRQRMINMMYIVLIAMLALNVDRYVLEAFHLMEQDYTASSISFDRKNASLMNTFQKIVVEDEDKAKPYYEKAQEAQRISAEFNAYLTQVKAEIEEMYDGRAENELAEAGLMALKVPEGMEKHAYYFMVEDDGKKAAELQEKINSTKDQLLNLLKPNGDSLFVDESKYNEVLAANLLKAEEPKNTGTAAKTWASTHLEYQPAGALMAMLTQFQNNAKALEADVIEKLLQGVNSSSFIIDELNAAIIPQSNYVMAGETYKADVMLMATASNAIPTITVNGSTLNTIEGNTGKIEIPATGVGEKKVSGTIEVKDPKTGKPKSYTYEHTYQVFKPVATVSAEAMKILYVGLDNPLSISVPGFSANDIRVTASEGASLSGGNGRFKAKVDGSQRKVAITVTAAGRNMGTTTYKVRQVPEPRSQMGGIRNDGRAKTIGSLCAQSRILANLGEGFAYDLPFTVTSFTIILDSRLGVVSRRVTGNQIPADIKRRVCSMRSGDRIFIEKVKTRNAEYGLTKDAAPAMFVIQ
ncbi:MAG: gliding motility protein GldM [Bacteroidia bacterium]